jgi:hypothetical protein
VRRTAALLILLSLVMACHLPEISKRAAIRAVSTFVLESAIDLQGRTVLTQSSARPALQTISRRAMTKSASPPPVRLCSKRVIASAASRVLVARCRTLPASDSASRPFPTS